MLPNQNDVTDRDEFVTDGAIIVRGGDRRAVGGIGHLLRVVGIPADQFACRKNVPNAARLPTALHINTWMVPF